MPYYDINYPPIPETTANLARSIFGKGNIYLTVGDQLDRLLENFIPKGRSLLDSRVGNTYCQLLLITAVQYEEQLTDRRLVEALPHRADILYALHLPEHYPEINPLTLCEFRQHLLSENADLMSFQLLLDRLASLGMFCLRAGQKVEAAKVLKALAISSHLEQVIDAFYAVLEKLAVENPEWLRRITLPHWYERYNRKNLLIVWPELEADWQVLPQDIGIDIHYLLEEIVKSPAGKISISPEVLKLKHTWEVLSEVMINDGLHKSDHHLRKNEGLLNND